MFKNIFSLLIMLCCAGPLFSAPALATGQEDGGIALDAAVIEHDGSEGLYRASGDVRMRWKGMTLLADKVSLRERDNLAEASGGFSLLRDGDRLTGERIEYNLGTERGTVTRGRLFMKKGNFHLAADRVEKTGAASYAVDRGVFTTCDGETPSWKFSASDLDVTMEEYATGRHAVFYIKDVPVFYTPYIIFPVKRERQSGLLMPRAGSSSKRGFFLEVPYYWAISPSSEATITLELQSRRGPGLSTDIRYLRPNGGEGSARAYLINDSDGNRIRGELAQKHMEFLAGNLSLKSDVNLVLDRDFYRDYAENSGDYNRKTLDSSLSLSKAWDRLVVTGELKYVEDLDAPNNRATLQKLPVLTISGIRRRLASTPLYFTFDSNLTSFSRFEGIQGQRVDLHPQLNLYASPVRGAELTLWTTYRHRFYNAYGGDAGTGAQQIGLLSFGGAVSSTLSRVYDASLGDMVKVRHLLIPEFGYSFVESKAQDKLPSFDFNDRIVGENMLTYSLTSRVAAKLVAADGATSYRDLLTLKVSQGYELSATRRDLLASVDDLRPFTDIRVEAKGNPTERSSFTFDGRFNPYRFGFSTLNFGFDLEDSDRNTAGLSYRHSREVVNYLEGRLGLSLVNPFFFHYTARYSFDRGDFLESYFAIEYRQQCWSVTLSYRDRPDNREYLVNFSLGGVGSLGRIKTM